MSLIRRLTRNVIAGVRDALGPQKERMPMKLRPGLVDGLVPRQASYPRLSPWQMPDASEKTIPKDVKLAVDQAMNTVYEGYGPDALAEGLGWLGYPYLAELTQRPEYRRAAEILSKEMTRKWMRLTSTADYETDAEERKVKDRMAQIEDALERYNVRTLFQKAVEYDGFFGRGQLYIDTGASANPAELALPLAMRAEKVGKGALKGFTLVDPLWVYPNVYNSTDPLRADFMKPETWFVMGKQVHASRLMFFVGRPVPDLLKPAYAFGGLALTQMMKPYVDNWLRTRQSVSDLLHSFSVMVLKTNMGQILTGGGAEDLANRLALFNANRDNQGTFALDKDTEEFENVSAPIAGLHELQAQSQEHMAAVTGIPLVKLLGITPTGLNASSEGELQTFYDWVHAQQETDLSPHLSKVLDIIQLSEFGDIDKSIGFQWNPLWDANEVEASTVRLNDANAASTYITAGVLSPEDERARLAKDDEGLYNGLDVDDLPELSEQDTDDEERDEATSGADA